MDDRYDPDGFVTQRFVEWMMKPEQREKYDKDAKGYTVEIHNALWSAFQAGWVQGVNDAD